MYAKCLGRRNPTCTARFHGTRSAYENAACTCPHAEEDRRLYFKRLRTGRHTSPLIDPTGTTRRLRALHSIGWTFTALAERMDGHASNLRSIARGDRGPAVHVNTKEKVAALYRELAGIPGPSAIARSRAAAKGWHSPIKWDDNIDDPAAQPIGDDAEPGLPVTCDPERVRRVVAGKAPGGRLLPAEKLEAFRQLQAFGAGPGAIQQRLGLNGITYRKLADAAAAADRGEVAA